MKKLIFILLPLFISVLAKAQFPSNPGSGNINWNSHNVGAITGDRGICAGTQTDTAAWNLLPWVKGVPYIIVNTSSNGKTWRRNSAATKWEEIGIGGSSSMYWNTTGNTATVAGTNFIGTLDNVRFDVRTNNQIWATILGTGLMGLGTVTPSSKLNIKTDDINVTQTDATGILLNTNAATVGQPEKYSPALVWQGFGLNTLFNSSESHLWNGYVKTFDGLPSTSELMFRSNQAGGGYADIMKLASNGMYVYGTGVTGVGQINDIRLGGSSVGAFFGQPFPSGASGTGNVSVGGSSMNSITSTSFNTAVGVGTLTSDISTGFNTAIGYESMNDNTSGFGNTALGVNSLWKNTTGDKNTALGAGSLEGNTTGDNNTATGEDVLYQATTASFNTASGFLAMNNTTTGGRNTAMGYASGSRNIDGTDNIFIGYGAGLDASQKTDAVNAIVLGTGAFSTESNVFVGGATSITKSYLRGQLKATSYGIGTYTGTAATYPAFNSSGDIIESPTPYITNYDATVDFSVNANPNTGGTTFNPNTPGLTTVIYVSTIDGSQWTWNGTIYVTYNAPFWAKTGNSGITSSHFVGTTNNADLLFRRNSILSGFLGLTNTGYGNSVFLSKSGTGPFNTAIGGQAMSLTTMTLSTANNTAVGYSTLANITGARNSAFGALAGIATTNTTDNTFLGYSAGTTNTTGSSNLFVGSYAGRANTTQSNQIFINSIARTSYTNDQEQSPFYAQQDTLISNQFIYLNGHTTIRGGTASGELRFLEPSGSGTNYSAFKAVAQASDFTYSLPPSLVAGGALTDVAGNGVLTWVVPSGGGLTVGTTTISSGTTTRILYNNAGTLGEYTLTGTGTVVAMQTSPSITTSLLTGSTTFALLNTTATTVNAFGAATTTNLFSAASGGILNLANNGSASELRFIEGSGLGGHHVGLKSPNSIAGNTTYTLPIAFPAGTYVMQSTTGGVMSWLDPSTIVPTLISTDGSITIAGNDIETRVYIDAGTYTPAITNGANVSNTTGYQCQWSRAGNVVTVSGLIDIDATLTATLTELTLTLPVASTFTNSFEAGGTGFCPSVAGLGFPIYADVATGEAKIKFVVSDINSNSYSFSFTYLIL